MLRRVVVRLALLGFGITIATIGFEIFLRMNYEELFLVDFGGQRTRTNHPTLGFFRIPNISFESTVLPEGTKHVYKTSEHGFIERGGAPFAEHEFRVMMVGDSVLAGFQVPANRNMSEILRHQLVNLELDADVLNIGVAGYSPVTYRLAYHVFKEIYKPTHVVMVFYVENDFYDPIDITSFKYDGEGRIASVKSNIGINRPARRPRVLIDNFLRATIRSLLRGHETFTFPAVEMKFDVAESSVMDIQSHSYSRDETEMINRNMKAVEFLSQELDEDRVNFMVVLVPSAFQVAGQNDLRKRFYANDPEYIIQNDEPQKLFKSFAKEHSITVVDPLPTFGQNASTKLYHRWDDHLTEEGHKLIAEAIAPELVNQLRSRR